MVTRLLSSEARSTRLSSMKVRSWLAVTEPESMTLRRSLSEPATVPLNRARSLVKLRIAEALSSWVCRTVLLSLISAVVTSKLSLAVWMKEFELSMSRPRSSPVPSKA